MEYIRHIVITHHKLLNVIDSSERKRMATIGDGIWKGIVASCVARKNINAKEMGELIMEITSNKNMAKFFPSEYITCHNLSNEHTRATFFEAAIYLEYNQYGFNYIQEKIHEGIKF